MDMNEYAHKKIALLERIAEALESINSNGLHVMNFHLPEGTALQAVGQVVQAGPAGADGKIIKAQPDAAEASKEVAHNGDTTEVIDPKVVKAELEKANKLAAEAAAKDKADKTAAAVEEKKATVKAPTADDARAALKKFAAKEGNDAAMELLKSFDAASVSSLMEKGDAVVSKMIAKVDAALKD